MPRSVHSTSPEPTSLPSVVSPQSQKVLAMRDKRLGRSKLQQRRSMTAATVTSEVEAPDPTSPGEHAPALASQAPELFADNGEAEEDPNEKRRLVQRGIHQLLRHVETKQEELMKPDSDGILDTLNRANALAGEVSHTADAAIDSRLLVNTAELAWRKSLHVARGTKSLDIDMVEFVAECVKFMGGGDATLPGPTTTTPINKQPASTRNTASETEEAEAVEESQANDGSDDDDGGRTALHWTLLGQHACLPFHRRPGLSGSLLASITAGRAKARKVKRRTARFRPDDLPQTRPEVLRVEDMVSKHDQLKAVCAKILQRLRSVQAEAQEAMTAQRNSRAEGNGNADEQDEDETDADAEEVGVGDMDEDADEQDEDETDGDAEEVDVGDMDEDADETDEDEMDEDDVRLFRLSGLRSTGGIDLMHFIVNPHSFSQTVENAFYVSFLIREGAVEMRMDIHGLPTLLPTDEDEANQEAIANRPGRESSLHSILAIDMALWEAVIEMYDIKEPFIEHRDEDDSGAGPGTKGWYG